ncbi:hypothetical protein HDV57DRAFT_451023 [Trichoderma longibrachiatum]
MAGLGPSGSNAHGLSFPQTGFRRSAAFPPTHAAQPNKQSPAPQAASPYQSQAYPPQQPPQAYPQHLFNTTASVNPAVANASSRASNVHVPSALNVPRQRAAPSRQQIQPQSNPPPMLFPTSMSQPVAHDSILSHHQQHQQHHPQQHQQHPAQQALTGHPGHAQQQQHHQQQQAVQQQQAQQVQQQHHSQQQHSRFPNPSLSNRSPSRCRSRFLSRSSTRFSNKSNISSNNSSSIKRNSTRLSSIRFNSRLSSNSNISSSTRRFNNISSISSYRLPLSNPNPCPSSSSRTAMPRKTWTWTASRMGTKTAAPWRNPN